MQINNMLAMGGYGIYVWTTYAVTLAVFSINILSVLRAKQKTKKLIQQYLKD